MVRPMTTRIARIAGAEPPTARIAARAHAATSSGTPPTAAEATHDPRRSSDGSLAMARVMAVG